MSISGIGSSLSSAGTQYNFKSMTNQQFLTAVQDLASQGKISQFDAGQLSFIAQGIDFVPYSGTVSVRQTLADPTQHNFITELQGDDHGANTPGAVGGAMYDSMLKDLTSNQDNSAVHPASTLSILS